MAMAKLTCRHNTTTFIANFSLKNQYNITQTCSENQENHQGCIDLRNTIFTEHALQEMYDSR